MAITASERADILELVVLMFDAAPGAAYLSDIVSAYEAADRSIPALAQLLSQTGAFQLVHPNFGTSAEFATRFLSTIGLQDDAVARDWVISQANAGVDKGVIIAAGWSVLNGLPESTEPQYLAARAMLENKASVAEYYSVVLRESSFDLAVLRDVVSKVTADPATAAAAIAELAGEDAMGPVLTPGLDNVQVHGAAHMIVTGLVDGNTANGQSGTYTAGDRIRGNGQTDLELTVIDGGAAGYVRVENIDSVALVAGTDEAITFNAGGWTGVGSVRLADGVNGMDAVLNNLEAGTGIGISDVTGSISAAQRLGDARVNAQLRNLDRRGEGGTYKLFADGRIEAAMADEVSLRINVTGDAELGDVTVEGGGDAGFLLRVEDGDDASIGGISVSMGDDADLRVVFDDIDGELAVGSIALSAGEQSTVALSFEDIDDGVDAGDISLAAGGQAMVALVLDAPGAGVVLGTVDLVAGDESNVVLDATGTANLAAGDISAVAGAGSNVRANFGAQGAGRVLDVGNVSLQAGVASTVGLSAQGYAGVAIGNVTIGAGDDSFGTVDVGGLGEDGAALLGDVSITLGDESLARLFVEAAANVGMGNVQQSLGASGSATVSAQASQALSTGLISQHAGDESSLASSLRAMGEGASLSVGGHDATAGALSTIELSLFNEGIEAGATTVGDVFASAGDDSRANVVIAVTGIGQTGEDAAPSAASMTVGAITVEVGDVGSIDGDASAGVNVLYGGKGAGADLDMLTIGDVRLAVGDGFVSGTQQNHASASLLAAGISGGSLAGGSFGDVSLEGGDFSWLNVAVGGAILGEDAGSIGDGSFGGLSMTGGEAAGMQAVLFWGGLDAASVGGMSVGDLAFHAKEDASLNLVVMHGVAGGVSGSVGSLHLGNIGATLGDNGDARVAVWDRAGYEGLETDANGDFSVGDIDIAVSATSTEDLSGRSSIAVSLRKEVWGLEESVGGKVTVGDVHLSAGAKSDVSFELSYTGTMASAGDVSVGTIALSVGELGEAHGTVRVRNEGGDIGSVAIAGHSLTLGKGASGSSVLAIDLANEEGDVGAIDAGDISLVIGAGAQASVSLVLDGFTEDAKIGSFRVGDVSVQAAAGAQADLTALDAWADAIGAVAMGGVDLALGKEAGADYSVDVSSASTIGAVSIGGWRVDAGEASSAHLQANLTAAGNVGAVAIGSLELDLAEGATVQAGVSVSGAKVGGTTIGDTAAAVIDGAGASILYRLQGDIGQTRVGDIHLAVEDGGALTDDTPDAAEVPASLQFQVQALGDANDHLTVGDIRIEVAGTADGDRLLLGLQTNGNLVIGDLTVSGEGLFSFDAADAALANTSVLAIAAGGTRTIGNVDFSGYAGDADIDLGGFTAGAASVKGGAGKDSIKGTAGANTIEAGKGVDVVDLGAGGNDTVVTSRGDSGRTLETLDTVLGFAPGTVVNGALTGGDKLDFNLVAGGAGNYAERSEDFGSFQEFLDNARDVLNSTVRYFVQDDGTDTYVAVNYGSGEADLVIRLAGLGDATTLQFQNFIA